MTCSAQYDELMKKKAERFKALDDEVEVQINKKTLWKSVCTRQPPCHVTHNEMPGCEDGPAWLLLVADQGLGEEER
jgi:hypothetical protein